MILGLHTESADCTLNLHSAHVAKIPRARSDTDEIAERRRFTSISYLPNPARQLSVREVFSHGTPCEFILNRILLQSATLRHNKIVLLYLQIYMDLVYLPLGWFS